MADQRREREDGDGGGQHHCAAGPVSPRRIAPRQDEGIGARRQGRDGHRHRRLDRRQAQQQREDPDQRRQGEQLHHRNRQRIPPDRRDRQPVERPAEAEQRDRRRRPAEQIEEPPQHRRHRQAEQAPQQRRDHGEHNGVAPDAGQRRPQYAPPGRGGVQPDLRHDRRHAEQDHGLQGQDREHRRHAGIAIGGVDDRDAHHHRVAEDAGQREQRGFRQREAQEAARGRQRDPVDDDGSRQQRHRRARAAFMLARAAGEQQRRCGQREDE